MRRSARYIAVLGIAGVGVLLVLALAARPWLERLLGAPHTPAQTQSRSSSLASQRGIDRA